MTELELLELLGDVQSGYLQQAEAFRQGKLKFAEKRRPVVAALKLLSMAAMFVLLLGAGYFGFRNLAAKETSMAAAQETQAVQSDGTADQGDMDWQNMVLQDGMRFYAGDSGESYTISEFCKSLANVPNVASVPELARYAVLDMDDDGQEELVVEFQGADDLPRLVLGSFDGQIHGTCYPASTVSRLKANGSFYSSADTGWAKLERSGSGWIATALSGDYSNIPDVSWTERISLGTAEIADSSETSFPTQENNRNLVVWQEGEETSFPATLFLGQSYSMYVPEEHWVYESTDYQGIAADCWIYAEETPEEFGLNTALHFTSRNAMRNYYDRLYPIRMTVLYRMGTEESIRGWVQQAHPEIDFTQNAAGSLYAEETSVFFVPAGDGVFVCVQEYPLEATEGAGMVMAAMWESFQAQPGA